MRPGIIHFTRVALSLSYRAVFNMAGPTRFELAIYSVTSCRGRPDSPMSPWCQTGDSNSSSSVYGTDALPTEPVWRIVLIKSAPGGAKDGVVNC